MNMRTLIPGALALLLCACASRPPEPTAAPTSSTTLPPAASSSTTQTSTTTSNTSSGSNAATAATPRSHEVFFAFDSSALSSDAQSVVRQNAEFAHRAHVRLEGNADERGSREYNLALGQRRAEAVREAMVLDGLSGDTVDAVSYGKERPRCAQETEDCFAENRRVDILVGQ